MAESIKPDNLINRDDIYRSLFHNELNCIAYCRMVFEDGAPSDFIYLMANETFSTETGLKDVVGKSVSELIPGIREMDPELFEMLGRASLTGKPERTELYLRSTGRWLALSVYSLDKGEFIAIFDVVTERKQAEESHRRTEARYARVLDGSDQSFWDWNLSTGVFSVSLRFETMLGYGKGELPGHADGDIMISPDDWKQYVHPDDQRKVWESIDRHCLGLAPSHEVEVRCHTKSGGWKWLLIYGRIVERDACGMPLIMSGTFTDISRRKQTESELKKGEERELRLKNILRALSATNEAIIHIQSEQELFSTVCRIVVEYGSMMHAWIGVPDAESRLAPVANYGRVQDFVSRIIVLSNRASPSGRGPAGTAFRENRPVIDVDVANSEKAGPWGWQADSLGIRSVTAYPLRRHGTPYAVLVVYSEQVGAFNDEIVQLLDEMASNISFALDNFDREAARMQAMESLKLAAVVYQESTEAMMVTDANDRIIAVNPAFENITGYAAREVIGNTPRILHSGRHGKEFYQGLWKSLNETGRWQGEIWNRAKDGREFAESLAINTTYNPDGSVLRRVALFSDITGKKESDELIWNQANYDALTGLPNRRRFRDHLRLELRKARRNGTQLAVMFLDLDGFKDINDTLGHDMGDLLLKSAAERLNGCVREVDTVARLGGDEFTVILPELQDVGNTDRVARHILRKLAEPFRLGEETAHVSASIGITLYPEDTVEIEDLLKNADQAMYAAKQRGRNQYQYFMPAMQEAAQTKMRLINDMRVAIGGEQFQILYQPIVELTSGSVHKAEALIRWHHPTRGLVSPIEFISAAEDTGMITSFGDWMFHEAARQAAIWRETYQPAFQISVNISPAQFRKGGLDLSIWFDHLKNIGLPGQGIVVEITEGLLLDAGTKVREQLLMLRDAGIEVSLDDFGTGYSSLAYLKKFDIDYIKIDQAFVRNLTAESDDMVMCEAIIVMAHKLGIKVIAEGIETQEQCRLLAAAGCDYGQGYLFSAPIPASGMESLFETGPVLI